MKTPFTVNLNIPDLKKTASHLPRRGKLAITNNNLLYLDIDDEYIHRLFPLLEGYPVTKPEYFNPGSVGAHISVIYPNEIKVLDEKDLGFEHEFTIKNMISADIGMKTYYALLVESCSLLKLRNAYSLSDMLCFKGYSIGFHVTIGVSQRKT